MCVDTSGRVRHDPRVSRPAPPVPAPTRLILVEGSIGTGKSTTARLLARALSDRGTPARAVLEGDLEHPADLESVALLVADELDELLAEHPGWAGPLRAVTTGNAEGLLVAYGVLERDHGPVPERLAARLRARDAYELPLAEHIRTRLARWEGFVAGVCARDEVWVLECCFLQNPLTVTLLRDDAPEDLLVGFVGDLARLAAPLSPVVVHLRADDVGEAFRAVMSERPAWWLDHVIGYYTGRGLGHRLGGTGVEGTVAVLRERASVEERVLDAVGVAVLPCPAARGRGAVALPAPLERLVAGGRFPHRPSSGDAGTQKPQVGGV